MKNTFIIILIIATGSFFIGCKKEKEDKPVADFTYTLVENGGVEIVFTGKGTGQQWDLGGEGEYDYTSNKTKFYYKKNGTYRISLKVQDTHTGKNKDEKTVEVTISGVPTKVRFTYITLKNYPDVNPADNSAWDSDGSAPDVTFGYINAEDAGYSSGNINSTPIEDLAKSSLPYQYFIPTALDFVFSLGPLITLKAYETDGTSGYTIMTSTQAGIHPEYYLPGTATIEEYPIYPSSITNGDFEIGLLWLE